MNRLQRLRTYGPYLPLLYPLGIGIAIATAILVFELTRDDIGPGTDPTLAATSTSEPTATPAGTPTPEATTAATPTPTPTSTPVILEPLYPPLTVGEPIDLPQGVTLFVWDGCTQCDGTPSALRRIQRVGDEIESTVVLEPSAGYLFGGWTQGSQTYVMECSTGCGSQDALGRGEATFTLHRSWTRGDAWESLGERAPDPDRVSTLPAPADWGIERTAVVHAEPGDATDGQVDIDGVGLDLTSIDGRGVEIQGNAPYHLSDPLAVSPEGQIAARWQAHLAPGSASRPRSTANYLTVFAPDGTSSATYQGAWDAVWLDEERLIATVIYGPAEPYQIEGIDYGWIPSIIDLRDGTVRPILDPFGDQPRNRNLVMGVIVQ